jgi:hypothetical protein
MTIRNGKSGMSDTGTIEEIQEARASINHSESSQPMCICPTVTYQVYVQGEIDPDWPGRLEGMAILPAVEQDRMITILEGKLRDQAALAQVLNLLYEEQLPVISVKWLNIW